MMELELKGGVMCLTESFLLSHLLTLSCDISPPVAPSCYQAGAFVLIGVIVNVHYNIPAA